MDSYRLNARHYPALWGGETWLASDLPGRGTPVADGPRAGEVIPLPILVKLIEARLALSVQVHPGDVAGGPNGKTEAWIIVRAEPGSRIYAGLRDGVGRSDLRAAIDAGKVEGLLHSFEPQVGDGLFLPAGTVHALGGGVTVFEVQQPSDVTYRLFDWGRRDPTTNQPRTLHVGEALECTAFGAGPVHPLRSGQLSISCPYFRLNAYRQPVEIGGDGVGRVLAAYGGAVLGCVDVWPGEAVVLPSPQGVCRLTPDPGAWLFECVLPHV